MKNVSRLVTCVVPTYNRPQYLSRALQSIANQTTLPSEVIVSDNGDTVPSKEIIEKFSSYLNIRHIKPSSQLPALENWKFGINAVGTEFTKIVWDDDWLREDCLEKMILWQKFYDADTVLCGATGVIGSEVYQWYTYREIYSDSLYECFPLITRRILPNSPLAALVRTHHLRYAVNEIAYPEKCIKSNLVVGPDMAMNFISLFLNGSIYFNPEPLVYMFGDGSNMTMMHEDILPNLYRKSFRALCKQHSYKLSVRNSFLVNSMGNDLLAKFSKIFARKVLI